MSKCRYNLSEDCTGYTDCHDCVIDKIRTEIMELDVFYDNDYFSGNKDAMLKRNEVLRIIYKYKALDQERDCEHCVHRKDMGCEKWDCEFERRQ